MKKALIFIFFLTVNQIFSQDFTKYTPNELKDSNKTDKIEVKHVVAAKMISYIFNGENDTFYFDTDGSLKAVSSKKFGFDVKANEVTFKENGKIIAKEAPKPEFLSTIKSKLTKAFELLKK